MSGSGWQSEDEQLLAEAAQWIESARSGTEADRAAFRQWLSARPEHVAAMDLVERAWSLAPAAARAVGATVRRPPARPALDLGRFLPITGGALAVAAAALFWFRSVDSAVFVTGPHARRTVTLADGTRAWLAPGSRIAVRTTPLARTVTLHGEVAFDVRHEWRSFAVDAGGLRTLDRGTLFSVSDRHGVSVLLARGSVSLQDRATGAVLAVPVPGQQVDVVGSSVTVSAVDAPAALAWRDGHVVAKDLPLAEVLARFAAQGAPPIDLKDAGLAALRISGSYASDDIEGFLTALATLYPVSWKADGAGYVVRRRR